MAIGRFKKVKTRYPLVVPKTVSPKIGYGDIPAVPKNKRSCLLMLMQALIRAYRLADSEQKIVDLCAKEKGKIWKAVVKVEHCRLRRPPSDDKKLVMLGLPTLPNYLWRKLLFQARPERRGELAYDPYEAKTYILALVGWVKYTILSVESNGNRNKLQD